MSQAEINLLRALPVSGRDLFINSAWTAAEDGGRLDVISPIDGKVFTSIARGSAADADRAVAAARRAFDSGVW